MLFLEENYLQLYLRTSRAIESISTATDKSFTELQYAFDEKIGCIVIDNFSEIELVKEIAESRKESMNVLIRVTPGVEASTHDYITTGQEDSKFGFDLKNGQTDEAFLQLYKHPYINLLGMHCHIGSQIFETDAFRLAAEALMNKMVAWRDNHDFICTVLNLGGGFGIRYTEEDKPLEPSVYVEEMATVVLSMTRSHNYPLPEIWIELGDRLSETQVQLCILLAAQKKCLVFGNMSQLTAECLIISTALYGAKYTAASANRMDEPHDDKVTIAGKCCESGDKLSEDTSSLIQPKGTSLLFFVQALMGIQWPVIIIDFLSRQSCSVKMGNISLSSAGKPTKTLSD